MMIRKGCFIHLVQVKDLFSKTPTLELDLVANEFQEVLQKYLVGFPPEMDIDFGIDLFQDTQHISIFLYIMDLAQHKELKVSLKDLL